MWYLKHKREHRRITCPSYEAAVRMLYRQWSDDDGSIPWTIRYS